MIGSLVRNVKHSRKQGLSKSEGAKSKFGQVQAGASKVLIVREFERGGNSVDSVNRGPRI